LHLKLRWLAMSVFVLASAVNFLDRSILNTLAPLIRSEFHLSNQQFGWVISAFSLCYALASPFIGYLLDGYGLNLVISVAVGVWSLAGFATGFVQNLTGLVLCRMGLGLGEAGGIPAVAKAGAMYLPPEERALGSALGQVGITVGAVLAPFVATGLALRHGWRWPFLLTGALGLFWIPLWLAVSRVIKPAYTTGMAKARVWWDRRLGVLIVANMLWMGLYSLWTNWTTLYLVDVHHLTLEEAQWYAWIPPLASNLGGFLGGWMAMRWIRKDGDPVPARLKVILLSAVGSLLTVAVPFAKTPRLAMVAISVSFLFILAGSVNIYVLPVDLFGTERAGFAISGLVFGYGLMQLAISPMIGHRLDQEGYALVCWVLAVTPLLAWGLLRGFLRDDEEGMK
jgi:MFS transporter, ACS family, hexuronate transporter